jgi:LuxR family maltose regulon positive regulatory protein
LIQQLNEGLHGKLTLISAPAGFGKTTLISEWAHVCKRPVAWVSLDEGDKDISRFLTYLVAVLQTLDASFGEGILKVLEAQHPPPTRTILTTLLNRITTLKGPFVLVLDDYHLISAKSVDEAVNFPGMGEEGEALVRAAYGGNYERLVAIKTKYDPTNLFHLNQNIKSAL